MTIDIAIQEAIRQAVREYGQSDAVSEKIIRWFSEVISGNENIASEDAVYRRIDILCRAILSDPTVVQSNLNFDFQDLEAN